MSLKPHHLTVPRNDRGRDFVVGDIHGHLGALEWLLDQAGFDVSTDRLFSVGDLVDRGPCSEQVVERFRQEAGWFAILGNHEILMIRSLSDRNIAITWLCNGGEWGGSITDARHRALAACFETLPLTIEIPLADGRRVGLVHAEVKGGCTWSDLRDAPPKEDGWLDIEGRSLVASALWGRRRAMDLLSEGCDADGELATVPGIDLICSGHNVTPEAVPIHVGNHLFLDTGAGYEGGRLSLFDLTQGRYWQCATDGRYALVGEGTIVTGTGNA